MDSSAAHIIFVFIIVMVLSGLIFLRIRVGSVKSQKDSLSSSFKRNNLVIAVIIVYFLFFWLWKLLNGGMSDQGIIGWKAIAVGLLILSGFVSLILILIGNFRKK